MSSPLNVHAASSGTTAPAIADSEHSNTGQLQGPHREGKRPAHASSGAPERDMSGAIRGGGLRRLREESAARAAARRLLSAAAASAGSPGRARPWASPAFGRCRLHMQHNVLALQHMCSLTLHSNLWSY